MFPRSSKLIKPTSNKASKVAESGNPFMGSRRSSFVDCLQGLICEALNISLVIEPVTQHRFPHAVRTASLNLPWPKRALIRAALVVALLLTSALTNSTSCINDSESTGIREVTLAYTPSSLLITSPRTSKVLSSNFAISLAPSTSMSWATHSTPYPEAPASSRARWCFLSLNPCLWLLGLFQKICTHSLRLSSSTII